MVFLLGNDTIDIKSITHEMRFDEVTARYGEFGDVYIGMQRLPDVRFRWISP